MNDDELIERLKVVLRKFRSAGLQQLEMYKMLHPETIRRTVINGQMMGELNGIFMPILEVQRRVAASEDIFITETLSGFWNFYLLNLESIDLPARQGLDRTLYELCYQKLLSVALSTPAEKKRLLLIIQLSEIGMILAAPSPQDVASVPAYTDDYNYWISQLTHADDRAKFQRLQDEQYPTKDFADAKHKLWPSFHKAITTNSDNLIFPWTDNTVEARQKALSSLNSTYLHQHDFVHGSFLTSISAVDSMTTRKHIFSSSLVALQAGYQVLHTVNEKYLEDRKINLTELFGLVAELVPDIQRQFSYTA